MKAITAHSVRTILLLFVFGLVARPGEGKAVSSQLRLKGLGAVALDCSDGVERKLTIALDRSGPGGPGTQGDEHRFVSHSHRVKYKRRGEEKNLPEVDIHSNCVVRIEGEGMSLNERYYLLPPFNMSRGLYEHKDVVAMMPTWRKLFALAPERVYDFRFVPDEERQVTEVYLDGSLAGSIAGAVTVKHVRPTVASRRSRAVGRPDILSFASFEDTRVSGCHRLSAVPHRANAALVSGARLSVGAGVKTIAGVTMDVWEPALSIDQGKLRLTTRNRDLAWNPLNERTPWATGPEYAQWRVPAKTWLYAHVLCADLGRTGTEPVVGTALAVFGRGCAGGNIDNEFLSLGDPEVQNRVHKVGTLSYVPEGSAGKTVSVPLYLVTINLSQEILGKRGQEASAIDFEFIGTGRRDNMPPSGVQIFGCTLVEAPYAFAVDNPVRGNIFEQGVDEQKSVFTLTAFRPDVRGTLEVAAYDPLFKPVRSWSQDFVLRNRGETKRLEVDLSGFDVGWYGLDLTFRDSEGSAVATHRASFAVLHRDDREAGYESPFAAWPQEGGNHGSNPDRFEQLEVMRKAGYRTSWHPPCTNETEGARWGVTKSVAGMGFFNPPAPCKTPDELSAHLDRAVAKIRGEFEAFPHCRYIQLLHETGGKTISREVSEDVPGVVGPYRGWCEDWLAPSNRNAWVVYYCTEFAKRMRKEFPDKKIVLGNGSSSCERIAALCREGFDLSLVDELGIESKGFSSLPELATNQESPAMLWALRETGKAFGATHLKLNACNEYVFRPERSVSRDWSPRRILQVTDFSLRDYLISLAHGCSVISSGHLEDCNDAYYETNWGAGGQCTFYPFSYPKRMFVALAVLTRALDKATYVRRIPTGALTAYALEFRRDRRVCDVVTACWTPRYGAMLELTYPAGARPRLIETFGRERTLELSPKGTCQVAIGSSPVYLVSDSPIRKARVVSQITEEPDGPVTELLRPSCETISISPKGLGQFGNGWGIPPPYDGQFELAQVEDDQRGRVVEVRLVRQGTVPRVRWETVTLAVNESVKVTVAKTGRLGCWVRGNGSFAQLQLAYRPAQGRGRGGVLPLGEDRGVIAFDGWQWMSFDFERDEKGRARVWKGPEAIEIVGIVCGSARQALDPIEMAPVTGELALGPLGWTSRRRLSRQSEEEEDGMSAVEEKDL